MSVEEYKIIHIVGILMVFSGLVGVMALRMLTAEIPNQPRRFFVITHGIGLLIVLIAGFGMAAKQGYLQAPNSGWIIGKIAIWLILGGSLALAKRKGQMGGILLTFFLVLGGVAAWLAIMKPF